MLFDIIEVLCKKKIAPTPPKPPTPPTSPTPPTPQTPMDSPG